MASNRLLSVLSLTAAVVCGWFVSLPAQQAAASAPEPVRRDALAQHRSAPRRAERRRRPVIRASRTPSTSACATAACGRRPTQGARGSRSSTISPPAPSAGSCVAPSDPNIALRRQRRRTAAARSCRSATASTSRPTPARRGRISACATRSRFPKIAVDPKNPNRLFVAALGHPYGPNEERGIFRSTDGGRTFEKRALQGREHRRQGRRHRSVQPEHRLRDAVGRAAGPVGKRRVERHERRHLQVDRRRLDVEAADAGLPDGVVDARARDRAEQPAAPLRDRRSAGRRDRASIGRTTPARRGRAARPDARPDEPRRTKSHAAREPARIPTR